MSLDIDWVVYVDIGKKDPHRVLLAEDNITHNLYRMFHALGCSHVLYGYEWDPDPGKGVEITTPRVARDIQASLEYALNYLQKNPLLFKTFEASNGWGLTSDAEAFLKRCIKNCEDYPTALIEISRLPWATVPTLLSFKARNHLQFFSIPIGMGITSSHSFETV